MAEFFAMGGYAFYVWTSYLLVVAVFGYLYVAPILKHRSQRRALRTDIGADRRH